jgi:hypothetical protein
MNTTRREFLATGAMAAGGAVMGRAAGAAPAGTTGAASEIGLGCSAAVTGFGRSGWQEAGSLSSRFATGAICTRQGNDVD